MPITWIVVRCYWTERTWSVESLPRADPRWTIPLLIESEGSVDPWLCEPRRGLHAFLFQKSVLPRTSVERDPSKDARVVTQSRPNYVALDSVAS